ncbi:hypothetical protein [Endozoicomonas numazuensis]|uniref:Uncharacterized protein n=1 Tax=Endozoicomonas numazuensis TaxID=1137799 RepID=A0A081NM56_9GAMM|nr:hypothetical protein [Endozoicomonas numazuensis]KEQ19529.1 hypothetical protein GZ78_06330 [Endozoicomonas numazuensis]
MDVKKYCDIRSFEPDEQTLKALEEIERQTKLSNTLKALVSSVPLYKIFVEPSPKGKTTFDALTYDWLEFEKSLKSIDRRKRTAIWNISQEEGTQTLSHNYNNIKFWKCVANATR